MPVFRARGRTRWGEAFAVRFEAPSERTLRAWLTTESAAVEEVRKLPLTAWPLSMTRCPWLIFLLPLFAFGLYSTTVMGVLATLDLTRVGPDRNAYERLAATGTATTGTVVADRDSSRRGLRSRTVDYRFVDGAGGEHHGSLSPGPGHVAAGRHDLRLLTGPVPAVGAELAVTYLAAEPEMHAPFPVDDALLARHAELCSELPGALARLALGFVVCAWMVRNYLVRLGGHFELTAGPPRLILVTRGDNPFVGPDEDEDDDPRHQPRATPRPTGCRP